MGSGWGAAAGAGGGCAAAGVCSRAPLPPPRPTHLQITAEQLLRESKALQESELKAPVVKLTDPEELAEYRLQKRKEFEDQARRVGRWNSTIWVKVCVWGGVGGVGGQWGGGRA